jgi:hypothetical protein
MKIGGFPGHAEPYALSGEIESWLEDRALVGLRRHAGPDPPGAWCGPVGLVVA